MTPGTVLLGNDCPLPLDAPFTLAVATTLGVSRRTLRTLVSQGLVRRVGQGVYAVAQAPNTIEFRAAALSLVVSPSAVVTDQCAAWLHGIDLLPRSQRSLMPPIQVFLAPGNRSRRPEVTSGERMLARKDITDVHGLSVTTPLRTACDLGRSLWRYDALAALDQFLRLGVGHDELLEEITRFKGYRGVIQLRYLGPIADPRAESVAESALRLHWYDAGLPPPEPQWWVFNDVGVGVYRLDIALPEASSLRSTTARSSTARRRTGRPTRCDSTGSIPSGAGTSRSLTSATSMRRTAGPCPSFSKGSSRPGADSLSPPPIPPSGDPKCQVIAIRATRSDGSTRSARQEVTGQRQRREAESRSRNQIVSSRPVTPAAGVSWRSVPSARARATASAFPSPLTRNHTDRDRLSAG